MVGFASLVSSILIYPDVMQKPLKMLQYKNSFSQMLESYMYTSYFEWQDSAQQI